MTVAKGKLRVRFHDSINEEAVLDPCSPDAIPPEVEHDVELLDENTEFYIEFSIATKIRDVRYRPDVGPSAARAN